MYKKLKQERREEQTGNLVDCGGGAGVDGEAVEGTCEKKGKRKRWPEKNKLRIKKRKDNCWSLGRVKGVWGGT